MSGFDVTNVVPHHYGFRLWQIGFHFRLRRKWKPDESLFHAAPFGGVYPIRLRSGQALSEAEGPG